MGIIFSTETLSGFDKIGVDIFSELVKGNAGEDMQENDGKGKWHPGLKTYKYKVKRIPYFTTQSPNGSVSSGILTSMLHRLDKHC